MSSPLAALPVITPAIPELFMGVGALVLVLFGAIFGQKSYAFVRWLVMLVIAVTLILVYLSPSARVEAFHGAFVHDGFARFMKIAMLWGSLITLYIADSYLKDTKRQAFEFPLLILIATLGMMLMISANDLIALYLGLELSSLSLYVIASFDRDNVKSTEAGLKYFVLGALSSGMLLYGASLIYGMTGAVSFAGIAKALSSGVSMGAIFGLVFILAGLSFKISAVPFHMWTPDVYEGAPTPVTAFFAAGPKIAAVALLVRVIEQAFPGIETQWQQVIVFIAIASMGLGAFAAIGQKNIKRLLAYSSIGHVGYVLVGLAAGTIEGVAGVATYLAIYLVTSFGAFACILAMNRNGHYLEDINELAGLSRTNPALAFAFAMLMFSLAGVPPLAGFFAKWYVFAAAVNAHLYPLAIIGVVTSVVGAYYYLRIVKIIYFDEPCEAFTPAPVAIRLVASAAAILVLAFVIAPAPLVNAASLAAKSLF
ncbi:MAG: NADH-quinone oxidoreductase subunit NuoN [Alphaproteobacteria bacterium]|nr:NADH-quinone oxidoreductase subunit NuoN [Alphaproteobacteria bacterium]